MNKLEKWVIKNQTRISIAGVSSALLAPFHAFAQVSQPTGVPTGFADFETAIGTIINTVIIVAGVAFVLLLLIGGVQYLAAAGNEDNTKRAQRLMLNALIGLVIVVLAYAVGTYVLRLLGISEDGNIPTEV